MSLSHSLLRLLNMGVVYLIMRIDIKAAEVCFLRPIYYFIFEMLLTSDDGETFFFRTPTMMMMMMMIKRR